VKKLIAVAIAALVFVTGCNKDKKPSTQTAGNLTEIAPPPPVHQANYQQPQVTNVGGYDAGFAAQPAPAPQQPAAEPVDAGPIAGGKTYTVKKGDTLWNIATRTYGDGKQYRKIVAANPSIKGDKVNVGQKIVLP
jgi:nucleoid-associated protein YgaU